MDTPSGSGQSGAVGTYGPRNIFYLRVSPRQVLSCILYIDPRHVLWLNKHPSIFHSTLKILKDRILHKLEREAKVIKIGYKKTKSLKGEISGNEVIDVIHQSEFKLAYFFRKQAEPHSVLIKDKQFIFPNDDKKGKQPQPPHQSEIHDAPEGGVRIKPDPEAQDESGDLMDLPPAIPVEEEQERMQEEQIDEKPKFKLKVKYRGYRIFTKALILVLEPSASARARSPDLFTSANNSNKRQLSSTPSISSSRRGTSSMVDPRPGATSRQEEEISLDSNRNSSSRTPTPLFFRGRSDSMTPSDAGLDQSEELLPSSSSRTIRPPVPRSQPVRPQQEQEEKEQMDDQEEKNDIESSSEWAERIRASSALPTRTWADLQTGYVGESNDGYAQMVMGASESTDADD
ncbi:unnamed protein product [Sympodiomycopsis kandeliae]